jgi:hypothetical protein
LFPKSPKVRDVLASQNRRNPKALVALAFRNPRSRKASFAAFLPEPEPMTNDRGPRRLSIPDEPPNRTAANARLAKGARVLDIPEIPAEVKRKTKPEVHVRRVLTDVEPTVAPTPAPPRRAHGINPPPPSTA